MRENAENTIVSFEQQTLSISRVLVTTLVFPIIERRF